MAYTVNTEISSKLLNELCDGSALTLEGLNLNSLSNYADYLNSECGLKDGAKFHVISGKVMNNSYALIGTNAYPDDLNIVAISLDDLEDFNKIVIKRFSFGGRWFDDIVANNAHRGGFARAI